MSNDFFLTRNIDNYISNIQTALSNSGNRVHQKSFNHILKTVNGEIKLDLFGFADEYSADDLDDIENLLIKLYKLKDEEDLIIAKAIVSIKILRTIFSVYAGFDGPKFKITRKSKYTIILYKHGDNEELLKDYFRFCAIAFADNSIILEAQHNYSLSKSFAFDDKELDDKINFFENYRKNSC